MEMPTQNQLTALAIHRSKWRERNAKTRADWFDWIATETGHRVESNTELTKSEAHHLITLLKGNIA